MDLCNHSNALNYQVAPTLFLEFHGTEESVTSQSRQVGKQVRVNDNQPLIFQLPRYFIKERLPIVMAAVGSCGRWKLSSATGCGRPGTRSTGLC